MTSYRALHEPFLQAAERWPGHSAVIEPGTGRITYGELAALTDRVRDRLAAAGVRPGDRVGIWLRKSIDAVATIYGILKAGAAYVPVDPGAPAARNAWILHDCAVSVIVLERRFEQALKDGHGRLGPLPPLLILDETGGGKPLDRALTEAAATSPSPTVATAVPAAESLAYILYTSGSTGKPKGVMLSHGNAVSFVDWCSETFEPTDADRFSSHAPLHFDLSILDLHLTLKHGAAIVLVGEEIGKEPVRLARLISEERITCWYSAPSILALLAQLGDLPSHDYAALRLVLFAGEVFPVKHLRLLTRLLPEPRYFNLYGPTETNVCTSYELSLPVPDERTTPYPIGRVCSHLRGKVISPEGREVERGSEGELCISGSGVMQGYWNLPEQTRAGFLVDADGRQWYRTGDLVVEPADGDYVYIGRRDRMVKRRGYRVELGEIEAGLYGHEAVREAAVISVHDEEAGIRIKACLSCHEERHPSIIEMKRYCASQLPLYMVPDQFLWLENLPKTSTDKIDYQKLEAMD